MKRVGKVVVLDSLPGTSSTAKEASQTNDYFGKLAPALETTNINDLPVLDLPEAMQNRLMDHQKIGVRWLHSLYLNNSGGILGDDMGLGKTYQVICLLAGLMEQQLIKRVLILAPVSVLPNWQRELLEHLQPHVPGLEVFLTNSDLTKKKRIQILDSTFHNSARRYSPKIVISSYHLVSNMVDDFANRGRWDYVILDEGHVIKNPSTKISKAMHVLSSNHRLILTGTPIQNNLNEFWALVNWATKGKRFGTLSGFKEDYTMPILLGQDPKANPDQRRIAEEAAQNLLVLTKPIILQRKKCELPSNEQLNLPSKIELVVWSPLASSQRELYEQFIHSRQFSSALNRSTCPVEVINHLKTVCRHPLLIEALEMNRKRRDQASNPQQSMSPRPAPRSQSSSKGRNARVEEEDDEMEFLSHGLADMSMVQDGTGEEEGELEEVLKSLPTNASVFDVVSRDPDVRELLRGSIKLRILLKLVHRLHFAGHRTLVFSQSRLMLDIIQRVFVEYGLASHRIDGSVRSSERQRIIDEYNDSSDDCIGPSICLLTTKACGFGITLTGADRVIIYDPSWNPAEDRQAVDRAYRIGQTKPVVVYRLIMASSVEEKMYEKQVFKDGLRVVTESGTSSRYFSRDETSDLFTLGPVDQSVVMERLWTAAGENMREFPDTRGELPSVLGFTRHDTLYTEARPNASSQGQDPYAQYVDAEHVASNSEDEMVGVPPTPRVKGRAVPATTRQTLPTPGKENILNALNKMRELANAQKQKIEDEDVLDLRSPQPTMPSARANRFSSAFDLSSPTATAAARLSHVSRLSGASALSDLTCDTPPPMSQEDAESEYQQLSASKLFQGISSPAPVASPVPRASPRFVHFERVGTPLCSDSDSEEEESATVTPDESASATNEEEESNATSPTKLESETECANKAPHWNATDDYIQDYLQSCTAEVNQDDARSEDCGECDAEEEEEEEDSPWSDATVAAFNVLKESKLYSPPVSPVRVSVDSAHDLPEHYKSPSMSQVETQRDFESFPQEMSHCSRDHGEDDHTQASDNNYFDAEDGVTSAAGSTGEESCIEDPVGRLLNSVLTSADLYSSEQQQECDPIGRLLESVLPSACAEESVGERGDSEFDVLFGVSASAAKSDEVSEDEGDSVENLSRFEECEEGGLDPHSEHSLLLHEEFVQAETDLDFDAATIGEYEEEEEEEEEEEGSEGGSDGHNCETSIMDTTQDSVAEATHAPELASTPLLPSEDSSQVIESDNAGCRDDMNDTELSFGEEVDEAFSDEEDNEFSFPIPSEASGTAGADSRKSRGGGYLLNLCEMGSMKRTSSIHSNASDTNCKSNECDATTLIASESAEELLVEAQDSTFSSPPTAAQSEASATTGAITTRKKKSPVFSNYMEPDLFASPPWISSSVFSPEEVQQRSALRQASLETPSSEVSNDPQSAIFASGGTEVDEDMSSAAGSSTNSPQFAPTFHDPLQDLVDQVRGLNLATAASSTPMSKISFQTAAGQFSNMIVQAQSVSRMNRSFAQLSDSESETDSADSSPVPHGTPIADAIERMSSEKGVGQEVQSPQCQMHGTPIAPPTGETLCSEECSAPPSAELSLRATSTSQAEAPFPRTALFHSPKRRSSIWRRFSTGTVSSVISGEESVELEESAEEGESEEDDVGGDDQDMSLETRSPALYLHDEVIADEASVDEYEGADWTQDSPDRSQTTVESDEVLSFDLFRDLVVSPLVMDPTCIASSNSSVLRGLGLKNFAFPVHRPHSAMSIDDIDTYNDFLQQGHESEQIEKYHSAAAFFERALELCDEDVALHGKLAWLLDIMSNS